MMTKPGCVLDLQRGQGILRSLMRLPHLECYGRHAVFCLFHAEWHRGDVLRLQIVLMCISRLRSKLALGLWLPQKQCCWLKPGKPLQAQRQQQTTAGFPHNRSLAERTHTFSHPATELGRKRKATFACG